MIRGLMIGFLAAVGIPLIALAQAPATTEHQHEQGATQRQTQGGQNQQMMQQMHQKMMAQMAEMDQKLDNLVSQMNDAQGQAKVDAMAAVISEMVNQRKQMVQHMSSMMGMMGQGGGMMGRQGEQGMMMGTPGGMMPGMMATFDPVCRAKIANKTAPTATYQGKTYHFCSEADKQMFLKDPAKYVTRGR